MTAQKLPQSDVNHILMHFCVDANDTVALPEEAEFTLKVSRGKLKLPTFFQAKKNNRCTKIYLQAFRYLQYTGYSLCNCFFEAFVKGEADTLKGKDKKRKQDWGKIKRRRLSTKIENSVFLNINCFYSSLRLVDSRYMFVFFLAPLRPPEYLEISWNLLKYVNHKSWPL